MPLKGLYTVNEAARLLELTPGAVRNAIHRGALAVDQSIPGRNFIAAAEIERYRREVLGRKGWATARTEQRPRSAPEPSVETTTPEVG